MRTGDSFSSSASLSAASTVTAKGPVFFLIQLTIPSLHGDENSAALLIQCMATCWSSAWAVNKNTHASRPPL